MKPHEADRPFLNITKELNLFTLIISLIGI